MIDWLSLIPAGLSLLGGIFGGDKKSTTTSGNSKQLNDAAKKVFTEAGKIYSKPYQAYPGQRVAGFGAGRAAVTPWLEGIGQTVQNGLTDANGLQARARQLLNGGPQRISVPTMVPGGPQVGMGASPDLPDMPALSVPSSFTTSSLTAPTLPARPAYVPPPAPTPAPGTSSNNWWH